MAPEHKLTRALRELIHRQRTAALGTLDAEGEVFVSRVPYAIDARDGSLLIHVSLLATHTGNLHRHPKASLLIAQNEVPGEPVHALPRVSIDVTAEPCPPDSPEAHARREIYLERFPEAQPMTLLGDFQFVRLRPLGARQVAGFGAARSLDAATLRQTLGAPD
ncbi:MAG: pyridoxamine 5'-phosphate oxidase family protein [Burkholderiaceae bacterium]